MSEIVEYAVIVRRKTGDEIHKRSVSTDINETKSWLPSAIESERLYAVAAETRPDPVLLMMRTCTPWCEVYQPKKENA